MRVKRALVWSLVAAGTVPVAALGGSFGYEVVKGTAAPLAVTWRRTAGAAHRVGELCGISDSRDRGASGRDAAGWRVQAHPREGSDILTRRERVYAFGIWPIGMQYFARDVSRQGPLDVLGLRLVWWSGGERHVVDTADRSNGRVEASARSVEVKGWIPVEASAFGVETLERTDPPTEWRQAWLHGSHD